MLLYVLPFWILLPCVCIAAWTRGGRPERIAAVAYALAAVASFVPANVVTGGWLRTQWWLLLVDLSLLAVLCALVVGVGAAWVAIAAACQTVSTLAHLARALDASFDGTAYALMEGASSYPTLLVLALAVWRSSGRSTEQPLSTVPDLRRRVSPDGGNGRHLQDPERRSPKSD